MPRTHQAPQWRRSQAIDLLRGLAVFFVLMNHVNMRLLGVHLPYLKSLPPQLAFTLVWNGQAAVQIFFVVSGFLITSTSLRRWPSPAQLSISRFLGLRLARIAPLLLALLAILSLLHLARVPGFVVSPRTGGLPRALLAALTFHINLLEATRGYLPASWDILWSLSVEELFYLAFPLVARLLPRRALLVAVLLLFILAGPFARSRAFNPNPVWREYSYLGGTDAIAFGCLTALLIHGRTLARTVTRASAVLGAALLIFCLCFSLQAYRWHLGSTGLLFTLLALGTSLLIAASSQSHWQVPRILAPLQLLGQRSYEVYLTHIFAVLALFAVFSRAGQPLRLIPLLFLSVLVSAGLLGSLVAVLFAEPLNLRIRGLLHLDAPSLGAAHPLVD